jgi:hypothetical protein
LLARFGTEILFWRRGGFDWEMVGIDYFQGFGEVVGEEDGFAVWRDAEFAGESSGFDGAN